MRRLYVRAAFTYAQRNICKAIPLKKRGKTVFFAVWGLGHRKKDEKTKKTAKNCRIQRRKR